MDEEEGRLEDYARDLMWQAMPDEAKQATLAMAKVMLAAKDMMESIADDFQRDYGGYGG